MRLAFAAAFLALALAPLVCVTPSPTPAASPALPSDVVTAVVCPTVTMRYAFVAGVPQATTSDTYDFTIACSAAGAALVVNGHNIGVAGNTHPVLNSNPPTWAVYGLNDPGGTRSALLNGSTLFGTGLTMCNNTILAITPPASTYCDHIAQIRYGFPAAGEVDFVYTYGPEFLFATPW